VPAGSVESTLRPTEYLGRNLFVTVLDDQLGFDLVASHPYLADTEGSTLPVDEWGNQKWWPQLQVPGGEVALEESLLGFQTYTQQGLPPMPIAAPRIDSIAAVASAPLDQGYLYFVAGCPGGTRDGSHYFASTLDEHNANIARANEECAGQ